jgi:hypothetical protein
MTPPDDDNGPITLTIDQLRARARAAAAARQQEVEAVYLRTAEQREKRAALAAMETPEDKEWLEKRRHDDEVAARVAAIAEETRAKIEAEENARALAARKDAASARLGAPRQYVLPRDGDRDLKFTGWQIGFVLGISSAGYFATEVAIYASRSGRIITSVARYTLMYRPPGSVAIIDMLHDTDSMAVVTSEAHRKQLESQGTEVERRDERASVAVHDKRRCCARLAEEVQPGRTWTLEQNGVARGLRRVAVAGRHGAGGSGIARWVLIWGAARAVEPLPLPSAGGSNPDA